MSIVDKIISMRDKAQELDSRIAKTEAALQEFNKRFSNIDNILRTGSNIDAKISRLSEENDKRIRNIETQLNNKIASFLSDLNRFENWFKEKDAQHIKNEELMHKKFDELTKDMNNRFNKFASETSRFHTSEQAQEKLRQQVEKQMDSLLETVAKGQREMQEKTRSLPSQKELAELRSRLDSLHNTVERARHELQEKTSRVPSHQEMSSIKESALKLEKELKNVVQESQRNISNIDERLKSFVEHSTLHKHFGEMKMDLATTESAFKQMTEELKAEMERIRSEYQNLPKLRGLEEQNLDLMRKLKLVEDKMNNDFDKVLAEIQKLGQIFARKAELAAYDGRLNVFEREVNQREQEFNNRIKQRLERLNSQLISVVQDRKGLSREALAELKSSKAMSEQLQAEMGILKEQVIQTQNAIVELNAFIQEQIRA